MTRRADRLFQIVQILRGRRLTTAAHLADRLGVSERTVYRDIRDLSLSGVPVEGEAGSGYRLMSGFDLPPLMLTKKCRCQVFRANQEGLETVYGTVG